MKKWILLGIAVFFIALILISRYFVFKSTFAMGKIRSVVESTLKDQLKREFILGEITGDPFLGVTINGLSVAKHDQLSEGTLVEIQEIKVKYSLLGLIRFKLAIDDLQIIQPKIYVEMDKSGKLNLPEFAQNSQGGKSRFTLLLSNADIHNGQVIFDDKRDSAYLTIDDINGTISGEGTTFKGEIKAAKGDVTLQKVTKHISDIVSDFEMAGDNIKLTNLGLLIGNSTLQANGTFVNGKVPKFDMEAKSKLVLNDFKDFAPQLKRLDGIVDVSIIANGELPDISGTCKIDSKSLYVNDLKVNDVKGEAKFSQKSAELAGITANIGKGNAKINGFVKLADGKLSGYMGDVKLSNLDTNNIISDLTGTKSPMSGSMSGQMLISGKELRPGAFQTKGDLELTNVSVNIPQNPNNPSLPQYKDVLVGNVKAILNVDGKSISINVSRDKTIMNVKGILGDDAGLKLSMELNGVDIAEMSSIATGSPSINGQVQILADATMKIVNPAFLASMGLKKSGQQGKIIKDIADLKGNIKVNVPSLDIPIKNSEGQPSQVSVGSVSGNLVLDDDHVRTDDFALLLDNAKCLVKADVKIEETPSINARLTLDSLLIEKYTKLFVSNMPIHGGLINGEIDVSGKLASLNGSGEMLVSDLSVGTRSIDPIIIPIRIQSNALEIPELIISSVGEQIKVACDFSQSGDYTLKVDSSPIDITMLYNDFMTTRNGEIISTEQGNTITPGGKLQISFSGKGNVKSPSLDGKIKFDDINYNSEHFGDGECVINVGNQKANVDVYLLNRTLVANVNASILEPFPFTAQLQLKDINVEPALNLAKIGDKVDMQITGDIKAHGNGADPMGISMNGALQNILLSTSQYKWVNKSPVNLNLADRKFKLDPLEMDSEGGNILLKATASLLGTQKEQKIEVDVNVIIKDLDVTVASGFVKFSKPVSGKIDCNINVTGDVTNPIITGQMDGSKLVYDQVKVDSFSSQISYKDGMFEIEDFLMKTFDGDAKLNFTIPIDLKDSNSLTPDKIMEKSIKLSMEAKNMDINILSELVPEVESAHGRIDNVKLEVTGQIKQPRINALVNLNDIYIKLKSVPMPIENLNGQLDIKNSKLIINEELYELSDSEYDTTMGFSWKIDKGEYNVNGNIHIPKDFVIYILKTEPSKDKKVNPFAEKFLSSIKTPVPDLKYPELQFDVAMKGITISPWLKGMVKDMDLPVDGDFSGTVHVQGAINDPSGEISINPINLAVNGHEIKNSESVRITFADKIAKIANFKLITKAPAIQNQKESIGSIVVSGNVNIEDKSYELICVGEHIHTDIASFLLNNKNTDEPSKNEPVKIAYGAIDFNINSKGKLDVPNIDVILTGKDIAIPLLVTKPNIDGSIPPVKDLKLDKLECDLSYKDDIFDVKKFNMETFGNTMTVNGKVPINISFMPAKVTFSEKEMDVKLTMNNFSMVFLSQFVDVIQEFNGNAQADISLLGTVKEPRLSGSLKLINADCRITASKLVLVSDGSKQPIKTFLEANNINLSVSMNGTNINVDDASFKVGDGKYKANGKLEMSSKLEPQAFEFAFKADPAKLDPFIAFAGGDIASQLSGEVKAEGKLTGDFRNFKGKPVTEMLKLISGNIDVTPDGINVIASGHKITNPKRVYAELKKGRLNLPSFKLVDTTPGVVDGSSIGAIGMWEIGGEKSFDLTAYIDTGFVSDFLRKPGLMQGRLGFKLEARGNEIRCFWPPTDDVHNTKLTVENATIDEFRGSMSYQNQSLDIKQIWLSSSDNKISITGNVPINGKPMSLQFDARLNDMGILSLVDKEISESGGRGIIGATVTGDIKKVIAKKEPVRFIGSCVFDNLGANFDIAYVQFKDINVDVEFDSKASPAIIVKELRGKMNDGDFVLDTSRQPGIDINWNNGVYKVGEFRNISVNMKDCTVYMPNEYSIVFDADPISLKGNYDAPKLTGNVTIKEGQYTESIQNLIQNALSAREIGVKAQLNYPIVRNLELDVDVISGNMSVNNGLANVETEFTARVRGSLADPLARANGRITEGTFKYLNREFTITKGEITNDTKIDPKYDIIATTDLTSDQSSGTDITQGTNIKIQMEIKGSLTERFPPIFSLLGGGPALQQLPDLSQNQIAAILALGSTPDQFLSRAVSSSSSLLMEPAKLYVESQTEKMLRLKDFQMQVNPRNPKETRLTAVKPIMEQISMTLDVGYSGQQWVGLQRDVGRNFAVAGKVSQQGDWGFDLKVKRDFP
jgi:autotransporter translocation and assembly factor TamB